MGVQVGGTLTCWQLLSPPGRVELESAGLMSPL